MHNSQVQEAIKTVKIIKLILLAIQEEDALNREPKNQ
jgi:hypothetical protein